RSRKTRAPRRRPDARRRRRGLDREHGPLRGLHDPRDQSAPARLQHPRARALTSDAANEPLPTAPLPLRVRRVRLVETHGVHLSPWIQGRREKFFRGTAASSPKSRPTHAEARETGEAGGSPPKNLLILRVATRGANSRLRAIAQGARVTGSIISPGLERRCPLPRSRPPAWARGPPSPLPSIPPTAKEFPM